MRSGLQTIFLKSGTFGLGCLLFMSLGLTGYMFSSGEGVRRSFSQLMMTGGILISLTVLSLMSK